MAEAYANLVADYSQARAMGLDAGPQWFRERHPDQMPVALTNHAAHGLQGTTSVFQRESRASFFAVRSESDDYFLFPAFNMDPAAANPIADVIFGVPQGPGDYIAKPPRLTPGARDGEFLIPAEERHLDAYASARNRPEPVGPEPAASAEQDSTPQAPPQEPVRLGFDAARADVTQRDDPRLVATLQALSDAGLDDEDLDILNAIHGMDADVSMPEDGRFTPQFIRNYAETDEEDAVRRFNRYVELGFLGAPDAEGRSAVNGDKIIEFYAKIQGKPVMTEATPIPDAAAKPVDNVPPAIDFNESDNRFKLSLVDTHAQKRIKESAADPEATIAATELHGIVEPALAGAFLAEYARRKGAEQEREIAETQPGSGTYLLHDFAPEEVIPETIAHSGNDVSITGTNEPVLELLPVTSETGNRGEKGQGAQNPEEGVESHRASDASPVAARREGETPSAGLPETTELKAGTSETETPETTEPEVATLGTETPETTELKAGTSETETPETTEPEVAASGTETPETTEPEVATLGTETPETTEPGVDTQGQQPPVAPETKNSSAPPVPPGTSGSGQPPQGEPPIEDVSSDEEGEATRAYEEANREEDEEKRLHAKYLKEILALHGIPWERREHHILSHDVDHLQLKLGDKNTVTYHANGDVVLKGKHGIKGYHAAVTMAANKYKTIIVKDGSWQHCAAVRAQCEVFGIECKTKWDRYLKNEKHPYGKAMQERIEAIQKAQLTTLHHVLGEKEKAKPAVVNEPEGDITGAGSPARPDIPVALLPTPSPSGTGASL